MKSLQLRGVNRFLNLGGGAAAGGQVGTAAAAARWRRPIFCQNLGWQWPPLPHPRLPLTPLQLEPFTTEFQAIYWTLHALCLRVSHLMNDFLSFGSAVATNYGVTFIFQTNLNFHEKPQFYVTSSQLTSRPESSPAKVLTYKSRGEQSLLL